MSKKLSDSITEWKNYGLRHSKLHINPSSRLTTGCVTSGKLLYFSEPQLSHLKKGGRKAPSRQVAEGLMHTLCKCTWPIEGPSIQVSTLAQSAQSSTACAPGFKATRRVSSGLHIPSLEERKLPVSPDTSLKAILHPHSS